MEHPSGQDKRSVDDPKHSADHPMHPAEQIERSSDETKPSTDNTKGSSDDAKCSSDDKQPLPTKTEHQPVSGEDLFARYLSRLQLSTNSGQSALNSKKRKLNDFKESPYLEYAKRRAAATSAGARSDHRQLPTKIKEMVWAEVLRDQQGLRPCPEMKHEVLDSENCTTHEETRDTSVLLLDEVNAEGETNLFSTTLTQVPEHFREYFKFASNKTIFLFKSSVTLEDFVTKMRGYRENGLIDTSSVLRVNVLILDEARFADLQQWEPIRFPSHGHKEQAQHHVDLWNDAISKLAALDLPVKLLVSVTVPWRNFDALKAATSNFRAHNWPVTVELAHPAWTTIPRRYRGLLKALTVAAIQGQDVNHEFSESQSSELSDHGCAGFQG